MNNSQGALYFGAGIDTTQWKRDIESMRRDILGLNNTVKNETRQIDSSFKNLSIGIAGYFSANALLGFTQQLINVRGEFQKTEIAFSTMLGDGGKAKELMGQMVDLAAKTPFSLQDVSNGAKQLLAFQVPADQVVDTLTRMGNIAAGLSVPLSRINLVYGQVRAKGKLMGDDLRQFTEAGIPMVAELAKKFNKTTAEVSAMVSAGKVGFKDVQDVLFSLTNEGGMFYNLMEKQSKSLSGQIANLGDAWDQMLNKIGESNEGLLSSGIEGLSYLVEHYEDVLKILTVLVATYGAYRAALIATAVIQKSIALATFVQEYIAMGRAVGFATANTIAFNTATLANPIAAVIAVLALVVASYVAYGDELNKILGITKELNTAQKVQQAVNEELTNKFSKGIAEQKTAISSLISVIRNEYSTLDQRKKAYEQLIKLDSSFRETLDAQYRATNKLGSAFDFVSSKMEAFARAQAQIAVKTQKLQEYTEAQFNAGNIKLQLQDVSNQIDAIQSKGRKGMKWYEVNGDLSDLLKKQKELQKQWRETQDVANDAGKIFNGVNTQIKQQTDNLQKGINVIKSQLKGGKVNGKTISEEGRKILQRQLDAKNEELNLLIGVKPEIITQTISSQGFIENLREQIKSLDEAIEKEVDVKKLPALTKKREALQKQLDSLLGKKEKGGREKQIAEFLPIGSIKELQQRAQLLQEAADVAVNGVVKLRKLDKYGKDKDKNGNPYLTGVTITKEQAADQIAAINALIERERIKTFEEQIAEDERQWRIRYQIAKQYGEDVAKAQFPDLKGESFYDELNRKFKPLNDQYTAGIKLSDVDLKKWEALKKILDSLNGVKDPFTNFTEGLDVELAKLNSSYEKIELLNSKLYSEDILSGKGIDEGRKAELIKRIEEEKKIIEQQYQEFLNDHRSFEEQKAIITDQYQRLRDKILSDPKLTPEQRLNALKKAGEAEADAYSNAFLDTITNDPKYREAFANMETQTSDSLETMRSNLTKKLRELRDSGKGTPEKIKELEDAINSINTQLSSRNPFVDLKKLIKDLGDESLSTAQKIALIEAVQSGISKNIGFMRGAVTDIQGITEDLGFSLDNAFGDALEKISGVLEGLDQMSQGFADIAKGYATGNPIQIITGGIKAIGGVVKSVSSLFNNDRKKERNIKRWADEVENLKNQYESLQRAVDKALGEDSYKQQQAQISNLRTQQQKLQQMIREEQGKKKTDNGKISEWQNQINEINGQIEDIYDNIAQQISGTNAKDLASQLADALIEAYGKGEDAATAYGKVADDVMKDAVKNALKMQLLEKPMQDVIKQLIKNMGFNDNGTGTFDGLTEEERAQIKNMMQTASQNYMSALGVYSDLFGEAATNASTLEGAVKGVTEETADIIAGQMNAIRIMQAEALTTQRESQNVLRSQLLQLTQIEFNTRNLAQIRIDISEMNNKMKDGGLRASGLI